MGAIFGFTGPPDDKLRDSMHQSLRHRGTNQTILHSSPEGTIGYLGRFEETERRRLGSGLYHEGDRTIALAGYLTGPQPASLPALLQAYAELEVDFVGDLRGAFVLVIQDGRRLYLVRDGAGQRTIFWARHQGRLLYAVEPKGIWQAPGFSRKLRPAAVVQYLSFSFIPGEATMLEGLHELPPGHVLSYDGGREPTCKRYFFFEDEEKRNGQSEDELVDEFRARMQDAVQTRLPPREPVGLFLSGGLDSSVVAAEAARQHDQPVRSYSIHFGKDYPHELEFASAVARRCGLDHEEVFISPKGFLPRLRQIIWHLDDPIGDPITVPNFELSAHAARDVRWVFNGEGGDPCFGGPKNVPMLMQHWYGGIEREKNFREKAYLSSYRRCYDDLHRMLTPDFLQQIDFERDLESILTPFFQTNKPASFLDKLAAINIRLKGGHLILPKVERMMGACGLTPLAPLFDEDLIRFSFAMPSHLRLENGIEKVILKRAYARDLPPEVIARPKSGMRVPVHYWFQKEMSRYARKILHHRAIARSGIFNPERVRQLLDYDIEEGPGRYGLRLWMLITFEIWRRMVVEGEPV